MLADAEEEAAYAPFTVVDQAVNAIAARREFAFAKGLVNAVLRNFLRERETLLSESQSRRGRALELPGMVDRRGTARVAR